jgi:SHS2 domain-containing protein
MGYRFIDHTADVAAELDGSSPGELFGSAAQALTDTITAIETVRPTVTQSVTLEAPTLDDLLVDWLNELLYRFEVHGLICARADVRISGRDGRCHLRATVSGEPFDASRHPARVLVKSATYHGLEVRQDGSTWQARIVFDI